MRNARARSSAKPARGLSRRSLMQSAGGLSIAAAVPLALAGCGTAGGTTGGKTAIRFLYATGDETWNSVAKAVADAFNAKSASAVVELDPLPAGTDYPTAMKTMDATGNWPALVDMRDTLTYLEAGKLAPIPESVSSLLNDEVYAPAEDGDVYIVPTTALNGELGFNMVYDKDYFEEHGLAVPTTYAEFIALLDAIQANGDAPLATAAGEIWPSDQLWKPLAAPTFAQYSEAGGFWNAVRAGDASIEDLREPLQRLKDITDTYVLEGWQSTQDAQTTTLLVNRQAVMSTSSAGIGRLNDVNKVDPDFNAGIFYVPADDGKLNVLKDDVNGDSASGFAISSQAKENGGKEYDAAVEFLEFYYSVDACNLMEETGMIAPNVKASDEIARNSTIPGAGDYFALLENPNLNFFQNPTAWAGFSTFHTFFRQARIEMQDGQTTIDECIAKSQEEFDNQAEHE
ncbi:ABC transporter substrate-binding protein [Glycomyces artemisiae]|uniref:Raffinose/stachyose/melibiose transport system substrate-binding protein n=1 Tax=Glycomyces artemisiae TaxID=1076443 RepID=A0A2T0UNR1_9ACTN|nr:ABC transporter substrate-binding protein [Glycomyces artemisiae]PRY59536.1 raffinose/stachyose/melibiose transport system substrate-binding protein [Glycomyces artemisiae]